MKILGPVALDSPRGLLALGLMVACMVLAVMTRTAIRHKAYWLMAPVAALTLGIQAFHLVEHSYQVYYWLGDREHPWFSQFAISASHGLTQYCNLLVRTGTGRQIKIGLEALHLIGNIIFLCGIVSLASLFRTRVENPQMERALIRARQWEVFHVLEHVVLTFTIYLTGRARGLSTLGGFVDGPPVVAWRVWFHFLLHVISTVYLAIAAYHFVRIRSRERRGMVAFAH